MNMIERGMAKHGGAVGDPLLELDSDELAYGGFFYSKYDILGDPHSQIILAKDREAFLDEYARIFRRRCEDLLKGFKPESRGF